MQRKFLTNLGLMLLLNLLIKPVWIFAIDRNVQNVVGALDYGFYFEVLNFSFLFNILLDLGITNFNNRNIAQSQQLLNKHFSAIVVLKFFLAMVYIFIAFVVALLMNYKADQMKLLAWLAFNQILTSFILYLRSNVSGLLMFKTDSVLSVLDRLLMILFCSVLLWGHVTSVGFRIEWFVYAQTAAYGITALVATLIVVKQASFRKLNVNWPFFLMIIKRSLPFASLVLLMTLYNRLDPVMIGKLLPDKAVGPHGDINTAHVQVGIYANGFRLLDAANMIGYLFSVLLIPVFSRMLKRKESVEKMVKLSFTLLITVAVIVALGCIFYSNEIMKLLYKEHFDQSSEVFRLLMGGFIAVSTTYIFGTLLTANGNLKLLNIVSLIGLVINFTINMLLIPRMMAVGSAYASLITQFFIAIVEVIIVQKVFKFRVNYHYLFTLVMFVIGVVIFNFLSRQVSLNQLGISTTEHSWLLNFLGMILLSIGLAAALKLLNIQAMLRIVREDR
ncbi:MAG: oligosaccharide flippase family protein [Bacteroidetes bacterium]|nr:oligosaccharide flippase family protein [Bacteroidota bacterium]